MVCVTFGLLEVANCQQTEDYAYVLGLRNSHDKRFPAGLAVGASVFVCDNLSFSGEIKIGRKHTRHPEPRPAADGVERGQGNSPTAGTSKAGASQRTAPTRSGTSRCTT